MKNKLFENRCFYEVYPSSFCDSNGDGMGDIQGIISKLDYIKSLGFDGLWLNPVYDSPFKDGGYDVRNFFKISDRFGSMEDLNELIVRCHEKDIMIFMDLVPGHVSMENADFIKSGDGQKNEMSDTFIWTDNIWATYDNYRLMSGFFDRSGCYLVNFFGHQPAINYGFAQVKYDWQMKWDDPKVPGKAYLEKVIDFYLDKGVDGFRVDMADSLVKDEDDKECTIKLWQNIFADIRKQHPVFYTTSEWSNPERALRAGFTSDFVLDHEGNFSHLLFRQTENNQEPLLHKFDAKLYRAFSKDLVSRVEQSKKFGGQLSLISGNHDSYRIADYLTPEELKLAYLFIYTMPGVPFLFAGDELGQKTNRSLTSIEGGYQRTGTRIPMVFDDSKNRGFSTTDNSDDLFLPIDEVTISAARQLQDPDSLLNFIKQLILLRDCEEDLRTGEFKLGDSPLSYSCGKIDVYINLKDEDMRCDLESGTVLFKLGEPEFLTGKMILKHHQAVVIKRV